jgi:hypothetical protein
MFFLGMFMAMPLLNKSIKWETFLTFMTKIML